MKNREFNKFKEKMLNWDNLTKKNDFINLPMIKQKCKEIKHHCWMYFVTALVPSETAWRANSPGRISLTADWTSLEERVLLLLNLTSFEPSVATLSKVSWMNEFMMFIAFLEIPISGWTCFKTL